MKKINLSITKCTNNKCKFRVIAETLKKKCPVCHSPMKKEKQFRAQGLCEENNSYIIFKKRDKRKNK